MKNITFILALFIVSISLMQAQDTIEVSSGWNMIGAVSTSSITLLQSVPPGILTSYFYSYQSGIGYTQKDTLKKGKGYWVKANQPGLILWASSSEITCPATVLYAGKTYNTVLIGTQCWFKENLNVGTMIDSLLDQTNNSLTEKYCYRSDPVNCSFYGGLYQWNEAMQYSTTAGAQGICPAGWHIPTEAEFQTLHTTVNGDGNALKAIGQGTGAGTGTDISGFSALLAGGSDDLHNFHRLTHDAYVLTSTEYDTADAYYLLLGEDDSSINIPTGGKVFTGSVRCLKD